MEEREQQPSGEEPPEQPSAEGEQPAEDDIEVSDLDVEEDEAGSVKGGASRTLLENPSAGGEIRRR